MENHSILFLLLGVVVLLLLMAAICYFVYNKNKQASVDKSLLIVNENQQAVLALQEEIQVLRGNVQILREDFGRFYENFFSSSLGKQIRYSNRVVELMKDEVSDIEENIVTNSCMIRQLKDDMLNTTDSMLFKIQVLDCKIESIVSELSRN